MGKGKEKPRASARAKARPKKKGMSVYGFYSRLGLAGLPGAAKTDNYFYDRVPTYTTDCAGV